jgi:hypothetical protein
MGKYKYKSREECERRAKETDVVKVVREGKEK